MTDLNLAEILQEGEKVFAENKEKVTPSGSPAEKKPEEVIGKDKPEEGEHTPQPEVPFHKHPRWIERENKLKELEEKFELTNKELAELKTLKEQVIRKETDSKVPEWFVELYGDNPTAWAKYSENEQRLEVEREKRYFEGVTAKLQQKEIEEERWRKWSEDGIQGLKILGLEFDRNELFKVMLENKDEVTNSSGNLDFALAYKLYKEKNPGTPIAEKSEARKQLADAVTKNKGGEKKPKDFYTSSDLRNKSWHDL